MSPKLSKYLAQVILGSLVFYFLYLFIQAFDIVNRRHISTENGVYINSAKTEDPYIQELSHSLTKNCINELCKVQNILNYVTNIPYKVNNFQAHSPQATIKQNFGDCDDKSNLLISLLHELKLESYFVLVPHHIFVLVAIDDVHLQHLVKGLYINNKKYYILETTVPDSPIGFPLHYKFSEIEAIIEPFENKKIEIQQIEWKI